MPRRPTGQSTLPRYTTSPHPPIHHKSHPVSSTPTKSLSRTSSRGDLQRSSRPRDMPDRPPPDTSSPHPNTPTPQKGGRRRKPPSRAPPQKSKQDKSSSEVQDAGENDPSSEDDEILFDLLGVPTPARRNSPIPGLLPVSKAQLSRSRKGDAVKSDRHQDSNQVRLNGTGLVTRVNGKGRRQPRGSMSESEVFSSPRRLKPNKKTDLIQSADPNISSFPSDHDLSALSASRPTKPQPISRKIGAPLPEPTSSFDVSSLSQSLPSERGMQPPAPLATKKTKGKKAAKESANGQDESAVWEMPDLPPPSSSQAMTWQQKLQSEPSETPRRNKPHSSSRSVNLLSEQKPRTCPGSSHPANTPTPSVSSPLVTRPSQTRRLSLDANSSSVPLSAFDNTIPYHTGYNVNRAPQTPMKLSTSQSAAAALPLQQGEYPRLKHGSKGPLGGLVQSASGGGDSGKYAGPTFHNSPHAATLPKPDMDDF